MTLAGTPHPRRRRPRSRPSARAGWKASETVSAAPEIGQHGLEIVKAVTEDLSVRQEPVGKRITARIALSSTSSSDIPHH
ncbi:hypothetical protein [Streptomyces sp. SLBN-115]|uniref:hypothetical protein n=1 Tax=Streptomyces sp. SLBN-115 TaxID=2768453 RepID=UPI003FCE9BAC